MKKIILFVAILVVTFTLSACSKNDDLAGVGLEGMSGKEILMGVADGNLSNVDRFGVKKLP